MEHGESKKKTVVNFDDSSSTALNSVILDYYKNFGRKRDLEQYFSLSTAQGEARDPSSLFWRRMKSHDSSDSGEKYEESSTELCRISIKCSVPESSTAHDHGDESKVVSESPPIITEYVEPSDNLHEDEDILQFDDNESQKSGDLPLDTSANKPLSPTSSINSQRKLEWDSLADVGYGNESDKKNSASSLSTIEKLALKQQYSNSDTKLNYELEDPTAHSTPYDPNDSKYKVKKGKKTTIYNKEVELVEVNVPFTADSNQSQAINVNLTKHISFNVEKNGAISFDNMAKNVSLQPHNMASTSTNIMPQIKTDKEIQTSVKNSIERLTKPQKVKPDGKTIPVFINLNTLKRRNRKRRIRMARKKIRSKKTNDNDNTQQSEKIGGQVSEAESFEYMPGHVYNQNIKSPKNDNVGNKSSLESSGAATTDSSKGSKYSFSKDLEKSIDLLKVVLQQRYNDVNHKNKLIQEVVQRLVKSRYRDDESTTDFLSGLSYNTKKLDSSRIPYTTTSTSDNNTINQTKLSRPRKSILRNDKSNPIASTSTSAPNLLLSSNSNKPSKPVSLFRKTDSEQSSKDKLSDSTTKTSSEELYQKYIEALTKERTHKKHLKENERILKQQIIEASASEVQLSHLKSNQRLNDLIKDLTRNNYDDGSGDASKLEGGSFSNLNCERYRDVRNHRNHSVFTLSSFNSENQNRKSNMKKKSQKEVKDLSKAGCSKDESHYCCCEFQSNHPKVGTSNSTVQVNMKLKDDNNMKDFKIANKNEPNFNKESLINIAQVISKTVPGAVKYVCLCDDKSLPREMPQKFFLYKCSDTNDEVAPLKVKPIEVNNASVQCTNDHTENIIFEKKKAIFAKELKNKSKNITTYSSDSDYIPLKRISKSSQTNLNLALNMSQQKSEGSQTSWSSGDKKLTDISFERRLSDSVSNEGSSSRSSKNVGTVKESTRWIQTEISINPKISNPSLSDIKIVNNADCVKCVHETLRQLSHSNKMTVSSCTERKDEFESVECTSVPQIASSSRTSKSVSVNKVNGEGLQSISKKILEDVSHNFERKENNQGSFMIPIKGTNMTLMVKLDNNSNNNKGNQKPLTSYNREICISDEGESLSLKGECSKGVQSESADIFNQLQDIQSMSMANINHNSNVVHRNDKKLTTSFLKQKLGFNTYPKIAQDRPKSKSRSNSDVDRIGSSQVAFLNQNYKSQEVSKTRENTTCMTNQNTLTKSIITQTSFDSPLNINETKKMATAVKTQTQGEGIQINSKGIQITRSTDETKVESQTLMQDKETQKDLPESNIKSSITNQVNAGINCKRYECEHDSSEIKNKNLESNTQEDLPVELPPAHENLPSTSRSNPDSEKLRLSQINNGDIERKQDNERYKYCSDIPANSTTPEGQAQEITNSCTKMKCTKCTCYGESFKCTGKCKTNKESGSSDYTGKSSSTDNNKDFSKDPIIAMIQDITNRYSKTKVDKTKKRKCFKEIVTVLRYLLDTDEGGDIKLKSSDYSSNCDTDCANKNNKKTPEFEAEKCNAKPSKHLVDVGVGSSSVKKPSNIDFKELFIDTSDTFTSTELPATSTDSAACKVLTKIKKECEKYHQKRCKSQAHKKCDISSSTSVNCGRCNRNHYCSCKSHKCKSQRPKSTVEKIKKKCVAYNLIIQTSDSVLEDNTRVKSDKKMQNVIFKVPSKRKHLEKLPFKEVEARLGRDASPCKGKNHRSRSLPNESELSSADECTQRNKLYTVRDYLEHNRPDFVEQCGKRQQCLKLLSETRANERAAHRELLSLQLGRLSALNVISETQLRQFARELGKDLRRNNVPAKFISEREMKKHSEKIYKSLPEVVQKKEDIKKENIKKTNLLMANIFKKNLQKKTLGGSVNLSNYTTVIKI